MNTIGTWKVLDGRMSGEEGGRIRCGGGCSHDWSYEAREDI